jgi:hypothetical protein
MEQGWVNPEEFSDAQRALTRQELLLYAEELAVEVSRWKAWCIEAKRTDSIDEAQAIQALTMVLIELLAGQHGSRATARSECARVTLFLAHDEDRGFLRTHRLRFADDEQSCA